MQILNPFFSIALFFTSWKHQEVRGFLMPSSFIKSFGSNFVWLGEMSQNVAQGYQCKQRY